MSSWQRLVLALDILFLIGVVGAAWRRLWLISSGGRALTGLISGSAGIQHSPSCDAVCSRCCSCRQHEAFRAQRDAKPRRKAVIALATISSVCGDSRRAAGMVCPWQRCSICTVPGTSISHNVSSSWRAMLADTGGAGLLLGHTTQPTRHPPTCWERVSPTAVPRIEGSHQVR